MLTKLVSITKEDITNLRFPSNLSVVIGHNLLTYDSSVAFVNSLMFVVQSVHSGISDPYASDVKRVRHIDPKSIGITKTVEEALEDALAYCKASASQPRSSSKEHGGEEPAFLVEMWGLQDALQFALQDFATEKVVSGDMTEDDIFDIFLAELGYWWVGDLCGLEKAISFLREFFDTFYPLMKSRAEAC